MQLSGVKLIGSNVLKTTSENSLCVLARRLGMADVVGTRGR